MSDRIHTAIHEAGHAVAADELEVVFDQISIERQGDTAGRIGVEGDDGLCFALSDDLASPENDARYWRWAIEQAIIDYAGHAAVVTIMGDGGMNYRSAVRAGAGPDFKKASSRLGGDRRRVAAAKARAIEIVALRTDDVQKIATALIEFGRLSRDQYDWLLCYGKPIPDWID